MTERSRISRVTTRGGDRGQTRLATGRAIAKSGLEVQALGSVDELNSNVGLLVPHAPNHAESLKAIQQQLFDIGAVLAMEGEFQAPSLEAIEQSSEALNEALPPLKEFVLPGGTPGSAHSHMCRSVCRRAESQLWALIESVDTAPEAMMQSAQYLNRLSDYFFILARTLNQSDGSEEQWQGPSR